MKSAIKFFFLISFIIITGTTVFAQGSGDGGGQDPDEEPTVPIDGGVSFLAAAGIAYGAKKIHDKRKQK